jgi:hypothetical protein
LGLVILDQPLAEVVAGCDVNCFSYVHVITPSRTMYNKIASRK